MCDACVCLQPPRQDMYMTAPYAYPPPPQAYARAEDSGSTTSMPWWLLVGIGVVVGGLIGKVGAD